MADSPRIADLHWVRPARQARSERTRDRLLDAAQEVVADKGFDGAGVVEIAELAGCSVGTIYRRFRHREGLMRALFEQLLVQWDETLLRAVDPERWAGASVAEILDGYLRFALRGGPGTALMRAMLRMGLQDAELGKSLAAQHASTRGGIAALLKARRNEIGHPRPDEAIDFAVAVLSAVVTESVTGLPFDPKLRSLRKDELVTEAVSAACAYLRIG